MAALLTVLTILIGVGLGLAKGGSLDRVLRFQPQAWPTLAIGLGLQLILRIGWLGGGGWATLVDVISAIFLILFAVANIRVGGMVLVVAGLGLNLFVTIINWGMPTSLSALESAGLVSSTEDAKLALDGARHIATDNDWLRFLGEVIALPTHQVISIGDVIMHIGYVLVIASLVRGRTLRRSSPGNYRERIAPLGQGPARRRGPGLHPSRLGPAIKHPSHADRER